MSTFTQQQWQMLVGARAKRPSPTFRSLIEDQLFLELQATIGNQAVSTSGMLEEMLVEDYYEPPFASSGYGVKTREGWPALVETIQRSKQVLEEYGMTCYASAIMYMIQSYGLIPPEMSRMEFEHAFTPLIPFGPAKTYITVGGHVQPGALPVDLFTQALKKTSNPGKVSTSLGSLTLTEATLRGAKWGGMPATVLMTMIPAILAAFKDQSEKKGYEFMKAFVPTSGEGYTPKTAEKEGTEAGQKGIDAGEVWNESSGQLVGATLGADYFKAGNTVVAGVDYPNYPSHTAGHWVTIVREKEATKEIAGVQCHLYPADDPLGGQVYVMAPWLGQQVGEKDLAPAGISRRISWISEDGITHFDFTYKERRLYMLFTAYARKLWA